MALQLGDIRSDLIVLKWMLGVLIAAAVPGIWILLRVAAKIGALG